MSNSLFTHTSIDDARGAELTVRTAAKGVVPLHPHLLGKFCEHLGHNIYNGMEAQIVANPTFAKWQFRAGECPVDGGERGQSDHEERLRQVREANRHFPDTDAVVKSYCDSLAYPWRRLGADGLVRFSPDVAAGGGRAQRVEILDPQVKGGMYQPVWLPLHRVREYQVRVVGRSADKPATVTVGLGVMGQDNPLETTECTLTSDWTSVSVTLSVPPDAEADALYCLSLSVEGAANVVVQRVLMYPADHIEHADADVVRMLKDSGLPLLRWPGGNFVSGYRWRDGVGPVDMRPTRPNPAWEGLEYNLFGTDEFLSFCRHVGCEPLICVNAGDGTPEEAAAWVEYCNGDASTPMGQLRVANGHPEPYNVKLWEIGNELWGRWQVRWTSPGGYPDRFRRFSRAMLDADPSLDIIATGAQCNQNVEWTNRLLAEGGENVRCVTDHILSGASATPDSDPYEVYQAYMGHAVEAGAQYRWLRNAMVEAGVESPTLAITEMQLFPYFESQADSKGTMRSEQLIRPDTIAEAVHFGTFLCECVRQNGFVRMITHSATVNHGGGLRKTRERVWANPVHHCHSICRPLVRATPVAVDLSCATYDTINTYCFIPPMKNVPVLDALAGETEDGDLLVFIVQRAREEVVLTLRIDGMKEAGTAELSTLAGDVPWDRNTQSQPDRIVPKRSEVVFTDGAARLRLPACSVALLRVGAGGMTRQG